MPQGRMLNKKISTDVAMSKLSLEALLLYTWTIPHLDVKGRIYGDATILKGAVVPYIKLYTLKVIDKCVKEWGAVAAADGLPLVLIYGEGQMCLQFSGFFKNQTINEKREATSVIPDPAPELLRCRLKPVQEQVKSSKVKQSKGNDDEQDTDQSPRTPTATNETPEQKKKYLDCVMLTPAEHKKLLERFGRGRASYWIDRLNNYIESQGLQSKYKSHYHTILNWGGKDPLPKTEHFSASQKKWEKENKNAERFGEAMPDDMREELNILLGKKKNKGVDNE